MPTAPADYLAAARRYGHSVDGIAARYRNPVTGKRLSGEALLVKLGQGESGFDPNAVSPTGARGRNQFMPASRQTAISKFGVDPWKNADQSVHAAALHLRGKINGSTGLEGYNPGDPSYPSYILGQKIGNVLGKRSGPSPRGGGSGGTPSRLEVARGPATVDPGVASDAGVRLLGDALRGAPRSLSTAPAPPAFSARPVTPQAYGGGLGFSGGGPSPVSSLAAQLADVGASDGQAASITPGETSSRLVPGVPGAAPGGARSGKTGGGGGASRAVAFAQSRVGQYKESAGSNRGPQLNSLEARFGFKGGGAPWCAMFTSVAVTRGGAPKSARTASVGEVYRQAQTGSGGYQRGIKSRPKAGDLMLFGTDDHIGMVESVNRDGSVNTIEGNTSAGAVSRGRRAAGSGQFVRPKYKR